MLILVVPQRQDEETITSLLKQSAESTHLLHKGKYHCMACLDSTKLVNLLSIQHEQHS